jgi:hypothetical protein
MTENTVLLFLNPHIKRGAEVLDKLTFKNGFVDTFDGPAYGFVLKQINKAISPRIPDEFKPEFHEAMDKVIAEDWDDAGAEAIDIVKQIVGKFNIEDSIKTIITGLLDVLKGALADLD